MTDEEIISRYQASSDATLLDALVERHLASVSNLAYRLVLCRATADDVVQEVFLKVMHSAHSFRGDSKFSTWLYRVTANAAREHLRKNKSETNAELNVQSAASTRPLPDHDAMQTELFESVENALGSLSDKLRAAIVLTTMEGLSAKEAASIEGCSTATIHWRVHEARKQLRGLLERQLRS